MAEGSGQRLLPNDRLEVRAQPPAPGLLTGPAVAKSPLLERRSLAIVRPAANSPSGRRAISPKAPAPWQQPPAGVHLDKASRPAQLANHSGPGPFARGPEILESPGDTGPDAPRAAPAHQPLISNACAAGPPVSRTVAEALDATLGCRAESRTRARGTKWTRPTGSGARTRSKAQSA